MSIELRLCPGPLLAAGTLHAQACPRRPRCKNPRHKINASILRPFDAKPVAECPGRPERAGARGTEPGAARACKPSRHRVVRLTASRIADNEIHELAGGGRKLF